MSQELAVIDQTYELIVWIHQHLERFPRHSRFSIGSRLESKALALLDQLIEAKYTHAKIESLQRAGLIAEQIRFLLRLCKDARLIAVRSHEHAIRRLLGIAKQVQGWRKQQSNRLP